MSGDFCLEPQEMAKLAGAFETRAYDLASAVRAFERTTGAEQIHDGFGFLTESEEATSAYIELAAEMAVRLGELARHFDEIGQALKVNATNSEVADDALADLFKGGKR
jgi:acetyl/propionyl-CoA carboxylase alpha subunit